MIGSDGGLQERPETTDILLVTPGERVDVIVTPTGTPGATLTLRAMLYNRGYGSVEYRSVEDVLTIAFSAEPPLPKPPLPAVARDAHRAAAGRRDPVSIVLTLPPQQDGKSEFHVNGVPFWKAKPFTRGARRDADLDGEERHQVGPPVPPARLLLPGRWTSSGQPIRPMAWKDTVNVPMKPRSAFS